MTPEARKVLSLLAREDIDAAEIHAPRSVWSELQQEFPPELSADVDYVDYSDGEGSPVYLVHNY